MYTGRKRLISELLLCGPEFSLTLPLNSHFLLLGLHFRDSFLDISHHSFLLFLPLLANFTSKVMLKFD